METPAPWYLSDVVSDVLVDKGDHDKIARLADLIEPSPSCELWDAEEQECYSVRTVRLVDRDALLALAEDVRGYCIERQITPWVAGRIYDRIREACGATQDD